MVQNYMGKKIILKGEVSGLLVSIRLHNILEVVLHKIRIMMSNIVKFKLGLCHHGDVTVGNIQPPTK